MELLVFLLGGAFGVGLSNLLLLTEALQKRGYTEDIIIDIVYECANILFIFVLFGVYMQLQ